MDGSAGEVRIISPNSQMRITWKPTGWQRPTTIQLRVIPNKQRTVIAFHQENLPGSEESEVRRACYTPVLDELERIIQYTG